MVCCLYSLQESSFVQTDVTRSVSFPEVKDSSLFAVLMLSSGRKGVQDKKKSVLTLIRRGSSFHDCSRVLVAPRLEMRKVDQSGARKKKFESGRGAWAKVGSIDHVLVHGVSRDDRIELTSQGRGHQGLRDFASPNRSQRSVQGDSPVHQQLFIATQNA